MSMITTGQDGGVVAVRLAARAINPLSRLFQRELATLLEKLEVRRAKLNAVTISFDAESGASSHELAHLMALTPAQAADCMQMLAAYNRLLLRLENLGLPVVAALSGEVSGHAFGLALACHHRLGLHDTRFSLPQVRLGLAPVAGEIVRTVRLVGLRAAMPLLLDGAQFDAVQARQAGLLHAIAADVAQLARLSVAVQDKGASQPWRARQHSPPGGMPDAPALRALLPVWTARLAGQAPPAAAILCAMVEGMRVNFEQALLIESRYFCQTAINPRPRKDRLYL
ncbi:enoyl-CoA hydratase/isomerase family protein [Duganella sp. P38]|uniref:enoyl-CoA hydratase/isomerase family protein n=1 Tax=Duganella sp. P38 TaxID=3423949 RepID=UPI003D7AB73B